MSLQGLEPFCAFFSAGLIAGLSAHDVGEAGVSRWTAIPTDCISALFCFPSFSFFSDQIIVRAIDVVSPIDVKDALRAFRVLGATVRSLPRVRSYQKFHQLSRAGKGGIDHSEEKM